MATTYKNVYFIGIGGIGMSAIARYFKFKGLNVSGYDKTESELTDTLQKQGIDVHYEDNVDFIPKDVENTLVVYTPAIPHDMGELVYVQEHGYKVLKRSKILGEITDGERCLAVAGTHGKTTTSTLTAHILTESGGGCSAFLGGISKNYGTNLLMSHSNAVVAEADEFDRSFLQLHPEIAVITAIDADHLDIYGDEEHYLEAFSIFTSLIRPGGHLLVHTGLKFKPAPGPDVTMATYSGGSEGDWHAEDITYGDGTITFTLVGPDGLRIENLSPGVPVDINIDNAVAAAAAALTAGAIPEQVREGLASFHGAKRRFEIWRDGKDGGSVLIDD